MVEFLVAFPVGYFTVEELPCVPAMVVEQFLVEEFPVGEYVRFERV